MAFGRGGEVWSAVMALSMGLLFPSVITEYYRGDIYIYIVNANWNSEVSVFVCPVAYK